mgnify:CR=1 FL=1
MTYSVVDLFAGAGGLSLGFMQTGKYDIKVAFEREPHMQETYHRNIQMLSCRGMSAMQIMRIFKGDMEILMWLSVGLLVKVFQMQTDKKTMQSVRIICW